METNQQMQKMLITYNFLSELSERARTEEQDQQLNEAQQYIMDHAQEYYNTVNKTLFDRIRFEAKSLLDLEHPVDGNKAKRINVLEQDETQIPNLPFNISDQDIDIYLSKIHAAQRSIDHELELTESLYLRWVSEIKDAEKRFKALFGFKQASKSESLVAAMFPEDVMDYVHTLGERVALLNQRSTGLVHSFQRISRLISTRSGDVYEPGTRTQEAYRSSDLGPNQTAPSMSSRYSNKV